MLGLERGSGGGGAPGWRGRQQGPYSPVAYPGVAGAFGAPYPPGASYFVPLHYFLAGQPAEAPPAEPVGSPIGQPGPGSPTQPILAMDALKARVMEAAPGDVKAVIQAVQFVPRAAAFTSLIQMAAKSKQPAKAIEIFEAMSAVNVQPNTFSYSALISALARAGRWQEAEQYFDELAAQAARDPAMAPNTVTYAALISAYEKGGQLDRALAAFERQLADGVAPDLITYTSLLTACERAGQLQQAGRLVDRLHAGGLVGSHQLYHGLLSACQAAGAWQLALDVFLGMQCATVRPTAHTVALLLGALAAGGQRDHALCALREALRAQYDLGAAAYNSVLQLLAGAGDWRAAAGVFRAMRLARAPPDAATARLVVSACAAGGNPELAGQLVAEMVASGLLPPPPTPPGEGEGGGERAADAPDGAPPHGVGTPRGLPPAAAFPYGFPQQYGHPGHYAQQYSHPQQLYGAYGPPLHAGGRPYRRSGSSNSGSSVSTGPGGAYSIATPRSSFETSPTMRHDGH